MPGAPNPELRWHIPPVRSRNKGARQAEGHWSTGATKLKRRRQGMFTKISRRNAATLLASAPLSMAQSQSGWPAADPADVASVDAIVKASYEAISQPGGRAAQYERFQSLAHPTAPANSIRQQGGGPVFAPSTVVQYIEGHRARMAGVSVLEKEIHRISESFGSMAHVWSTFEATVTTKGQTTTRRGINSLQLAFNGSRWWIVAALWDFETPDHPLPTRYLGA